MSLRGKGSTLGTCQVAGGDLPSCWGRLAKLLGSKFTLVFLMQQPRSYTLEDYQCSSWSCAVMQPHLATSIGFLSGTNGVGVV